MHPLLVAVASGEPGAADALRDACDASGGPLRQRAGERTVVTFVWFGDDGPVALQSGLVHHGRSTPLQHIDGSPVWWHEVDAPSDALVSYRFVVDDPFLSESPADDAGWQRLMLDAHARSFADPRNPVRLPPLAALLGLPTAPEQFESILALDDAPPAPWFEPHDAPAGGLTSFVHHSDALGDERTVTVWTPRGGGTDLPLLVLLDGESFLHIAGLPRALDAAVHRGDIAPLAVAFVEGAHGSSGLADRTRELSCNPLHARMLALELIPRLRADFPVDSSPASTILGGASLGGLQSTFTAIEHRDVVGTVLSVSGSFWYGLEADGEPEWLARRIAAETVEPLRMYQQIGTLEDGPLQHSPGVTHLDANRRFHHAAVAAGHHVTDDELTTAHDICTFRVAVLRGLQSLLPR